MKHLQIVRLLTVAALALVVCGTATVAHAQTAHTPPAVTVELRDAPVRDALVQIFTSAKVDYSIDPRVVGTVTLKVTDLPFESALKLILRSSPTPLTYSKDGGVYLVKPRVDTVAASVAASPAETQADFAPRKTNRESIELTYVDPMDLAQLLNITLLPIGTRQGIGAPGSTGLVTPGLRSGNGNAGATPPARPGGNAAPGGNNAPPPAGGSGFGALIGF